MMNTISCPAASSGVRRPRASVGDQFCTLSAQRGGDDGDWLGLRSGRLSCLEPLDRSLKRETKKKLTQVQVFHGVLAQSSFEWSKVLSHVCGHIKKRCQEKRQNKQGKPINECWNLHKDFLRFCPHTLSRRQSSILLPSFRLTSVKRIFSTWSPFAVPSSPGQHVPVPVHCCSLSLLIMCSAATRPVGLILLIRDTDTQSCTQRMELQPFPTRRWGYGRVADEENPEWCGCLCHTCCWTGIRCGKSTANQWHAAFCSISVLTFEGATLLTDSWTQALPHLIYVSRTAGKWKLWQSKTQEVSLQPP